MRGVTHRDDMHRNSFFARSRMVSRCSSENLQGFNPITRFEDGVTLILESDAQDLEVRIDVVNDEKSHGVIFFVC
jgi:hypothetical protein